MTKVFREHCCLVLDRNTLTEHNGLYRGIFVPADFGGTNWLENFNDFYNYIFSFGNPVPVEYGPSKTIIGEDSAQRLSRLYTTDLCDVGLIIINITKLDSPHAHLYDIKFKPAYNKLKSTAQRLESKEPFILAAKAISDDRMVFNGIHKTITQIFGLQLLAQDELEIPIRDDLLQVCAPNNKVTTAERLEQWQDGIESVNNSISQPTEELKESIMETETQSVVTVNAENHLNELMLLGNSDVGLVVKLNLAAGNFVDYTSPSASVAINEANIKRQLNIDASECGELWEAYIAGDVSLLRDALADKRITLNGFQPILPFSLIKDYRVAVENNFTRFDSSHERALETQVKYENLGVKTYITQVDVEGVDQPTTYFVNKVLSECVGTDGNTYAKDKWVKSAYFTDDSFKHIDGMLSMDANDITKRYMETRKMIKGLLDRIDHSFTAAIVKLED